MVVGFAKNKVEEFLGNYDSLGMKINTIYNPFWETTNSLFSLWAARFQLNSDVVLLGVSRNSKTPTSIYLANRGYKTTNIPIILNKKLHLQNWPQKLYLENWP